MQDVQRYEADQVEVQASQFPFMPNIDSSIVRSYVISTELNQKNKNSWCSNAPSVLTAVSPRGDWTPCRKWQASSSNSQLFCWTVAACCWYGLAKAESRSLLPTLLLEATTYSQNRFQRMVSKGLGKDVTLLCSNILCLNSSWQTESTDLCIIF